MRFLPKQLSTELFEYTSHLPAYAVRNEIEALFIKTKGFDFSINLTGKFIDQYEFKVIPKWEIGTSNNIPGAFQANIKVYIYKNDKNQTQVNLLVSPNSLFSILFFLLPALCLFTLFTIEDERRDINLYLLNIALFIVAPVALLFLSNLFKKRLLNRFVNYFHLEEII